MGRSPSKILDLTLKKVIKKLNNPIISDDEVFDLVESIARNTQNRAVARFILACALAKIENPSRDIRKPYTEIGDTDVYSGRKYDETYIAEFVNQNELPCNTTTAFLTPAFRNRNTTLTPDLKLEGRPPKLYESALILLDMVEKKKLSADELLAEMIRMLVLVRDEKQKRMQTLITDLRAARGETLLSAEQIVSLIRQHLALKRSSRLPVLIVGAVYEAAREYLGEKILPFESHTAADLQTGSLGDLEITLIDNQDIITSYEMKTRSVTKLDIDLAIEKIAKSNQPIENYIFITTKPIGEEVAEYSESIFDRTGIEVAILDCIGFLRYFLHLFYRIRYEFLEVYQRLVLKEPDSAVSQPLKEAFLAMRQAAETSD